MVMAEAIGPPLAMLMMMSTHRIGPAPVALETTLLLHGVPRGEGLSLGRALADICRAQGASSALVGVVHGVPTVGMTDDELMLLLAASSVAKANTSNLGVLIHQKVHAATTVSATMELAAAAGVRIFATGGLGGVHFGYGTRLDISADLAALARFPVAVVTSGVKSILDVVSTREALETLGVPVVGFGTDNFPAFYVRSSAAGVDARFDDAAELAAFIAHELQRTGRGIVVANPIPAAFEIDPAQWEQWLAGARTLLESEDGGVQAPGGRDATPRLLSALHHLSGGATLAANISLIKSNVALAATLARATVSDEK